MKGDFSRFPYQGTYSLVLMQQGRVQLDADWNEQAMIQWFSLQKLAEDLIGEHGGPANNCGFKIDNSSFTPSNELDNFDISSGRYYVKGVLCENDENCTFASQKNYPNPKIEKADQYLVYLHVWFRHITDVQDNAIREVALNGADTATRVKIVWQVKVVPFEDNMFQEIMDEINMKEATESVDMAQPAATTTISNITDYSPIRTNYKIFISLLERLLKSRDNNIEESTGLLEVQTNTEHKTDDSCSIPPQNRYRGIENQLYRVEIHKSGKFGEATFKWSRDNGAIVFPIAEITEINNETITVVLEHLGRDERCGLKEGDWVEIVDDDYELQGKTEDLLQVTSVDSVKMEVTLSGTSEFGGLSSKHPFLRRWDHKGSRDKGGVLEVEQNKWIDLENGIQIRFTTTNNTEEWFRSGDWWWIPARTATGDVEWPKEPAQKPFDQGHRYAPLAIISIDQQPPTEDLLCQFNSLK